MKHPVQYKTWSFRQFITFFWREELSKEWGHITHKRTCTNAGCLLLIQEAKKMLAYFLTKWDVNKSIPDAQKVGGDNREIKGVRDE